MENDIKRLEAMGKIMSIKGELDPLYKQLKTTYDKVDALDLDANYISTLKATLSGIILMVHQVSETLCKMICKLNEKDTDVAKYLDILNQTSDNLEGLIPRTYAFLESIDEL